MGRKTLCEFGCSSNGTRHGCMHPAGRTHSFSFHPVIYCSELLHALWYLRNFQISYRAIEDSREGWGRSGDKSSLNRQRNIYVRRWLNFRNTCVLFPFPPNGPASSPTVTAVCFSLAPSTELWPAWPLQDLLHHRFRDRFMTPWQRATFFSSTNSATSWDYRFNLDSMFTNCVSSCFLRSLVYFWFMKMSSKSPSDLL